DLASDIGGANYLAPSDFDSRAPADPRNADVGSIRHQLDIALNIAYFEIAVAQSRFHGYSARHGDFQVVGDALVIRRAVLIAADEETVSLRDDLDRRVLA